MIFISVIFLHKITYLHKLILKIIIYFHFNKIMDKINKAVARQPPPKLINFVKVPLVYETLEIISLIDNLIICFAVQKRQI